MHPEIIRNLQKQYEDKCFEVSGRKLVFTEVEDIGSNTKIRFKISEPNWSTKERIFDIDILEDMNTKSFRHRICSEFKINCMEFKRKEFIKPFNIEMFIKYSPNFLSSKTFRKYVADKNVHEINPKVVPFDSLMKIIEEKKDKCKDEIHHPSFKRGISKFSTFYKLILKSKGICPLCGKKADYLMFTKAPGQDKYKPNLYGIVNNRMVVFNVDHIRPLSKGGTNDVDNLQLTCCSCNSKKGSRYEAPPKIKPKQNTNKNFLDFYKLLWYNRYVTL